MLDLINGYVSLAYLTNSKNAGCIVGSPPVYAISNLRGSFKLLEVTPSKSGFKIKNELTIEIEGEDKPACVAETLGVLYPSN